MRVKISLLTPQIALDPRRTIVATISNRTSVLFTEHHTRTNMTLAQIIKIRTDDGRTIVDFLLDVMQDRYKDFRICHRLQAARLLTTYGNEDAPSFIVDNSQDLQSDGDRRKSRRPTKFDTELARVIRNDTDDGRSIARFLVNVMEGELTSFRPHQRMAAARELLDRGFGKSARKESTEGDPLVHPEPVEGPEPSTDDTNKITVIPESDESQFRQPTNQITPIPESQFRQSTDLLDTLVHLQPERFEQTVLDLLESIGYGRGHHLGSSGDGGIDGIIDQDALGIDKLYVQAKRWAKPVGEPEIRNFSGSLDPHGATKGLLITTSDFTDRARRTAETISSGNKHIRLIDGTELAQLMISVDMGRRNAPAHRARKLDEDPSAEHT